jgi:oxygen-dependent protoporphyrinogen oxidase
MFPERAPPGHWLHAVFLGGIGDAGALELSDDALVAEARATQGKVLAAGPTMGPLPLSFRRVQRWRGGIPQYTPGHRAAMRRVRELVSAALPGVALAGNHLEGVSVDDAARTGLQAAAEADLSLRSRQGAPVRHAGVSRVGAAEA